MNSTYIGQFDLEVQNILHLFGGFIGVRPQESGNFFHIVEVGMLVNQIIVLQVISPAGHSQGGLV